MNNLYLPASNSQTQDPTTAPACRCCISNETITRNYTNKRAPHTSATDVATVNLNIRRLVHRLAAVGERVTDTRVIPADGAIVQYGAVIGRISGR